MYLSLYRKWRPKVFDEISGQEHITSILKKQCVNNRVSHAYLFCGTRGTGKTSSAKILAKAINCENPIDGNPCNVCSACKSIDNGSATDVLEIDAASNNKVDNIRDLRDEVVYPPSVLKKRVYIVDEVHMLTDSAFNALLKTLEEPPEYVVFILATTEINELPPTIISRCIRFDFSRINAEAVKKRLEFVANEESITLADGASDLLARLADGSMRDALSLLEACSNGYNGELTIDVIRNVLGLASDELIFSLLHAISEKNVPDAIEIVDRIHKSSKDISVFIDDLSVVVRDIIIEKQLSKFGKSEKFSFANNDVVNELSTELLFYISSILEETQSRISKYAMNKRVVLDMAIIKMCDRSVSDTPKALSARIADLEKKLSIISATGIQNQKVEVEHVSVTPDVTNTSDKPSVDKTIQKTTSVETKIEFNRMSDVYEFLSDQASLCAFLKLVKVYEKGDNIVLCGNSFSLEMIKGQNAEQTLIDAFSSVIGRLVKISYEDCEITNVDTNQVSLIDELL